MSTVSEKYMANNMKQAKDLVASLLKDQFQSISDSGVRENEIAFSRISIKMHAFSPTQWLLSQNHALKVYWSNREKTFESAGVGYADLIECFKECDFNLLIKTISERLKNCDENIRFFGGFKFDSSYKDNYDSYWDNFATFRFIIPRFEVVRDSTDSGFVNFIVNINRKTDLIDNILDELSLLTDSTEIEASIPPVINRKDFPNRKDWDEMINTALSDFSSSSLEKVVLARKTELEFSESFEPIALLDKLNQTAKDCFNFCFKFDNDSAFLGATPERLYLRENNKIKSEAVAGTRKRGETPEEDKILGDKLLSNQKEIREHKYVVDSIKDALEFLCKSYENGEQVRLLKLAKVQHLYAPFHGILKDSITDVDILEKLHPTPAVGGYPTARAIFCISNLEPFNRGWYAAPVGWIARNSSEFAVAIRSGLLVRNKLNLYSGAGILEGSTPENEWKEIENKLGNFIKAIGK